MLQGIGVKIVLGGGVGGIRTYNRSLGPPHPVEGSEDTWLSVSLGPVLPSPSCACIVLQALYL